MRYRVVVLMLLMLLAVLPAINLPAAPAPYPSAILALGGSPDLKVSDTEYRKGQKEAQNSDVMALRVFHDPEVQKLDSVARMSDPIPWLAKNLRVVEGNGGRRLYFTFRAGKRYEQVIILNAYLRVNLAGKEDSIKNSEEWLRIHEDNLFESEQRLKRARHPRDIAYLQKSIHYARTEQIPELRECLARLKQTRVIKWAI